ncbi:sugar transferase [Kaistella flava (ex Peng et al. 2021)]|uniref:Sugar transferase n=1 Tax=Kaistella flava (ex Peng et al. 2021) TaxID=2038776 RepID=A0A7M2YCH2_9FLAO|nr:sugar transferase [Kaistella flava (ex Peng et al. 2021)]
MGKRLFDLFFALLGLILLSGILLLCLLIASIDTQSFGLFVQDRIGQYGKTFRIYKIKSMNGVTQKVTPFGRFLRASKLDEFPQLLNIIFGQMSFVGPRPDIPGYADDLPEQDRLLLNLKPGLTGLASLKYRNEEQVLAMQSNPLHYNDTVIWPDKVRLNNWYAQHRTFAMDLTILCYTFLPFLPFDVEGYVGVKDL